MKSCKIALSFSALCLVPLQEARAWRETAHFTVCEIAYRRLSAPAKESVKTLMNNQDFATSCTWPDMVRKTKEWAWTYNSHFINLDEGQTYPETINPKGDVVQGLIGAEDALRNPDADAPTKTNALKFLAHFIGDIHQPLHVGHVSDLGGNKVNVTWFGQTEYNYVEKLIDQTISKPEKINLHKVWDLHMMEKFIADNKLEDGTEYKHKAYADKLESDELDAAILADWRNSTYLIWADESFLYRNDAYAVGNGELGKEYYEQNIVLANVRIRQAGYRLAGILDNIFSNAALTPAETAMRQKIKDAIKTLPAPEPKPVANRIGTIPRIERACFDGRCAGRGD